MCDFFRKCAAVFLAAGLIVLIIAGFYAFALPDRFTVSQQDDFAVSTLFPVSAKPCERDIAAASYAKQTSKSTLMLFGTVPIKDVTTEKTERPMLVPCGTPFGVKLITNGVLVVGLQENCGKCAAKQSGIRKGDIIMSIDGKTVCSNEDVGEVISQSGGKSCTVKLIRDGKQISTELEPDSINGEYKAGMWVRDSSAGIGTMTFYDSKTGLFGGLGHPICDAEIQTPLPLSKGKTGKIKLSDYKKSKKGSPGWLSGDFVNSSNTGTVLMNTSYGVFGELYSPPEVSSDEIPLGFRQEIQNGEAEIYTSIDNSGPKKYKIKISNIDLTGTGSHDFDIEVTDKELIDKTGGILQGMSGSPIIQSGRLVGAVTHVIVDDPKCGFAVFADRMYEQCGQIPHKMEKAS